MNDVIVSVNEKTGVAYKKYCSQKIGNQHQNLQNKLKFEFIDTDNIPKGIAWLEYEIDGSKNYALMEEYEKGYQIDIKSCLLVSDRVDIDLKITQEENPNGIPVFVSSIVNFEVEKTINAEEEEPEQYPSWFESANAKLVEFDNAEKIRNDNEQAREEYIDNLKSDVDDGKFNGATFKPSVDSEGNLSFTNDKGLDNPETVNIRGPQGADYIFTEQDKKEVVNIVETDIQPTLNNNLKQAKDYTDNQIINDIKQVEYDEGSATFTFTRHDGTTLVFDLPIEQLLKDGYYDDIKKELVLVLENNQEIRIPASGLIDDYSTEDSDTIQLNLSASNVFKAILKGQSIQKTHLSIDLQNEFDSKLESDDLTDYVKNTDYASNENPGIIRVSDSLAIGIGWTNILLTKTKDYNFYKQASNNMFIGKGTLENVIKGKELVNKTYVDDLVGNIDTLLTDLNSGGGVE